MIRTATATVLLLALGACGQAATESDNPQPGATPATSGEAVAATSSVAASQSPAAFAQCAVCHKVEPGRTGIGPSLAGVAGRKAGTAPGYAYSAALKSSGLTWDDATLDRYLEAPMKTVPGTKMVYPGLKDPAKRGEVIAYLKTI